MDHNIFSATIHELKRVALLLPGMLTATAAFPSIPGSVDKKPNVLFIAIDDLTPGLREVEVTENTISLPQYFRKQGFFSAGFGKLFHDGSIPKDLQNDESDVWGPAPGSANRTLEYKNGSWLWEGKPVKNEEIQDGRL